LISFAHGQQLDPKLYQGLRWRLVGPFRGGRTVSVAGIPGNPNVYYFGSVGGGVWKTTNDGVTWNPIFDSQSVASVGAIALAPSDPNTIYVGAGEPDLRSDLSTGNGVYKSTDAGATWQHIGLEDSRQIARIVIDPHDANIVLVAAVGHAYGPNPERGVFKSTDGGKTWTKALFVDDRTGAIDLAADPGNPRTLYAAMWRVQRPPWSQYPPDNGGGAIYRSTDEGDTWTKLSATGLPDGDWGRTGIRVAPGTGGKRLYALIDNKEAKQAGLFRSDDGGASWSRAGTDPRILGRLWYFGEIAIDPKNADTVYLPNVSIYRSTDAGRDWDAIKGAPGGDDYHALWIDPTNPERMITGSDQGATISVDGGKSWSSWYNQPTAQFYHVITDNEFPYHIYGSQQDSGTAAIASRSDYGTITFRNWYSIGAGESGYIAPDPSDANTVYGGDPYGPVLRFDRHTGQSQDVSPMPVQAFGSEISQRKLRATWTSPIVISPRDSHIVYFGSQYLLRSSDRGMSWQPISPDLTGAEANSTQSGPPTMSSAKSRGYGVIYTVAPSPLDTNVIWTGSDTGLIYLTRDGGKTWSNVTPPGLSDWSKISIIDAGHFDAGTAYAAVDRHRLDDMTPWIYRTHDYGKTWKKIVGCISGDTPNDCKIERKGHYSGMLTMIEVIDRSPLSARVVREDPEKKGLLFAGTDSSVFFSIDDGDHWSQLRLNLPVTPIHDLVIKGNDLVVATHGRSFWVLDDISPLRELTSTFGDEPAHLFKPAKTSRVRRSVNNDTPLPPEEPQGENPPAGAIIYYFLGGGTSGEVTLEILDHSGQVIRGYSSNDQPHTPRTPPPFPDYWLPKQEILSAEAGMHRFTWDLRYAPPGAAGGGYAMAVANKQTEPAAQGPLVVPGAYHVRLTVAGRSYEQPLEVGPDPRVKTTQQEFAQQFDLAKRVYDRLQQAALAIQEVEQRRTQLKQQPNPDLDRKLVSIAGAARGEEDEEAPRPGAVTLRQVSASLSHLLGVVESADAPPTKQASDAAQDAFTQLEGLLGQLKQLGAQ
jgi:photosystem II stability/assembly factor-like uncharacterized protein